MADPAAPSPHPPPLLDRADLDQEVFRITALVWTAHFVIVLAVSQVSGNLPDVGSVAARMFSALTGAALSWAVHLTLSRFSLASARARLGWTMLALAPMPLVLRLASEFYLSVLSDQYTPRPLTLIFDIALYIWLFAAWGAFYVSAYHGAELRARDRRLAQAERAAQSAQLALLKFQINPHFLFNTLNSLSGLIHLGRHEAAEVALMNLSNFLRHTLEAAPAEGIPLSREVEATRLYLSIEQVRYGDRMSVRFEIDDVAADAQVPSLILQPLVENAVKHAVAASQGPAGILIAAQVDKGRLSISIENSAPDRPSPEAPAGFGMGLENVRQRLSAVYGETASLSAGPMANGGWRSEITLPAVIAEAPCAS